MSWDKMNRGNLLYEGKRTLGSLLGVLIYAVGVNLFVVPAGLYTGGVMGICQVIRTILARYFKLNFGGFDIAGVIYYIVNVPIFVIAFTRMGKLFFMKTLAAVTFMTLFLSVIPIYPVVEDHMASCVVGGILAGAGLGLVLRMGSSGGGMDVIGVVLTKRKKGFSVGMANLMVNLALYTVCLSLFDVEIVVYSVIYSAVNAVAMDRLHTQNINVEVHVITKADTAELEKAVCGELERGVTQWTSMGAYTREESHVLYILLSKYEVHRLKAVIRKYDPNAFMVVNEGVSVDGNFLKKL